MCFVDEHIPVIYRLLKYRIPRRFITLSVKGKMAGISYSIIYLDSPSIETTPSLRLQEIRLHTNIRRDSVGQISLKLTQCMRHGKCRRSLVSECIF